jgi:WD40 repeat protein
MSPAKGCVSSILVFVVSIHIHLAAPNACQAGGGKPPSVTSTAAKSENLPRLDLLGDPLPEGAVARIGTSRVFGGNHAKLLAYVPDGKTLVTGGYSKVLRFWEADTGKRLGQIEIGGNGNVDAFAFSPDGKMLVLVSRKDALVRVWDFASRRQFQQFAGERGGTSWVAFSPDGKRLAATSDKDVRVWDASTWEQTQSLRTGWVYWCAFLADGKTLVTAGEDIRWWDVAAGRELRRIDVELDFQTDPVLSPDRQKLAAVAGQFRKLPAGQVQVWNAVAGEEIGKTDVGFGRSWCLAFSPDSQTLLCSGPRGIVGGEQVFCTRFVAAGTGKELRRWAAGSAFGNMVFSPSSKSLVHLEDNLGRLIQRLDVLTGKQLPTVPKLPAYVMSVGFLSDSKTLMASCWGGHTGIWDALTGKQLAPVDTSPRDVVKPGANMLIPLQAPPFAFDGRNHMLLATALTPDGKKAAVVDAKGVLHIWEPTTGKSICRISEPPISHDLATFSPDGQLVVVKHDDHVVRLWEAMTGKLVRALPQFGRGQRFPHPHAISPDGKMLATAPAGADECVIRLWDVRTGKEITRLIWDDPFTPACLVFSPESKLLVAGSGFRVPPEEKCLRIWNIATGRELRRIAAEQSKGREIKSVAIAPDSRTVAATLFDTVVLWEVATGEERGRFAGHKELIWTLAFSSDGRLLGSGSGDYTALVWDVTGISPKGKLPSREFQPNELDRLWTELGGADARKAYRAMWTMVAAERQAVAFLESRVRPAAGVSAERLERLVSDLDSEQFKVRTQASKELEQLGDLAEPALSKILAGKPSLETRRRAEALLNALQGAALSGRQLQELRAVEVLENVGTVRARRVLETLAQGAPGARLTNEAKAAVDRLMSRVNVRP